MAVVNRKMLGSTTDAGCSSTGRPGSSARPRHSRIAYTRRLGIGSVAASLVVLMAGLVWTLQESRNASSLARSEFSGPWATLPAGSETDSSGKMIAQQPRPQSVSAGHASKTGHLQFVNALNPIWRFIELEFPPGSEVQSGGLALESNSRRANSDSRLPVVAGDEASVKHAAGLAPAPLFELGDLTPVVHQLPETLPRTLQNYYRYTAEIPGVRPVAYGFDHAARLIRESINRESKPTAGDSDDSPRTSPGARGTRGARGARGVQESHGAIELLPSFGLPAV